MLPHRRRSHARAHAGRVSEATNERARGMMRTHAAAMKSSFCLLHALCFGTALANASAQDSSGSLISELAVSLPACTAIKKTSDAVRSFLALSTAGQTEQSRACLLLHLTTKRGAASPTNWALAAAVFASHKTELLAHVRTQRHPTSFDVIGPMPIGKNEVDGDPLAAHGGAFTSSKNRSTWRKHGVPSV